MSEDKKSCIFCDKMFSESILLDKYICIIILDHKSKGYSFWAYYPVFWAQYTVPLSDSNLPHHVGESRRVLPSQTQRQNIRAPPETRTLVTWTASRVSYYCPNKGIISLKSLTTTRHRVVRYRCS